MGNVVATNAQGQKLETEQLSGNQKKANAFIRNVDSKVTQKDGVILGEGFESDEQFQDFIFRRPKGKVVVDTAPKERADSTGLGRLPPGSSLPVIREGEAVAKPKS